MCTCRVASQMEGGVYFKELRFSQLFGNLFGHLGPISNEGANLFGRGSVQNESQTQAPPKR